MQCSSGKLHQYGRHTCQSRHVHTAADQYVETAYEAIQVVYVMYKFPAWQYFSVTCAQMPASQVTTIVYVHCAP